MTDPIYFDTDCLSSFLWVHEENILEKLYSGRMFVPAQVEAELANPSIQHLHQELLTLISRGTISLASIYSGTNEFSEYQSMTSFPSPGLAVIGKGEAAAIVLAKSNCGIVASNNLRDVRQYVDRLSIPLITTGDILIEAYKKSFVSETQANQIWAKMLSKRRKLGTATFSDYLSIKSSS